MLSALHTGILAARSAIAALRIAHACGYDGIEYAVTPAGLPDGGEVEACLGYLSGTGLRVFMLDYLPVLEADRFRLTSERRGELRALCRLARTLGCATVQVCVLDRLSGLGPAARRACVRDTLVRLADVADALGVRLAVEPVCFSGFPSLAEAAEVAEGIGARRAGLVLDTWHLWASATPLACIAALDPALIACAHVSDALDREGPDWSDAQRCVLPGNGVVPLGPLIEAVSRTGQAGWWTAEAHGRAGFGSLSDREIAGAMRAYLGRACGRAPLREAGGAR